MSKFVSVTVGGLVWLAYQNGMAPRIMLYPMCRVGDCRRDGQRMNQG